MKYLCAIYSDESAWRNLSPQDSAAMMADYEAFLRHVQTDDPNLRPFIEEARRNIREIKGQ